jgi:hypothetical protein
VRGLIAANPPKEVLEARRRQANSTIRNNHSTRLRIQQQVKIPLRTQHHCLFKLGVTARVGSRKPEDTSPAVDPSRNHPDGVKHIEEKADGRTQPRDCFRGRECQTS